MAERTKKNAVLALGADLFKLVIYTLENKVYIQRSVYIFLCIFV